jgi:hypothetical protein
MQILRSFLPTFQHPCRAPVLRSYSAFVMMLLALGCGERPPAAAHRMRTAGVGAVPERHSLEIPPPAPPPSDAGARRLYDAGADVRADVPAKGGPDGTVVTFSRVIPPPDAVKGIQEIDGWVTVVFNDCDVPAYVLGAAASRDSSTTLVFRNCTLRHGTLAELNRVRVPLGLQFVNTPLDDVSLAGVDGLSHLISVSVREVDVTSDLLRFLAGSKELRSVDLPGSGADDKALSLLVRDHELTALDVSDCRITDEGVKSLEHSFKLRVLRLARCKLTDAGVAYIARLTNLESLSLDGTAITDAGLRNLRALHKLRVLGVADTAITSGGLRHLAGLHNLVYINVTRTSITAVDAAKILPNRVSIVSADSVRSNGRRGESH